MTLKFFSNLRNFDWILFGAVVLLLCFGLSALYSIAISSDQPDFSNFRKQIIFACGPGRGHYVQFGGSAAGFRFGRITHGDLVGDGDAVGREVEAFTGFGWLVGI